MKKAAPSMAPAEKLRYTCNRVWSSTVASGTIPPRTLAARMARQVTTSVVVISLPCRAWLCQPSGKPLEFSPKKFLLAFSGRSLAGTTLVPGRFETK